MLRSNAGKMLNVNGKMLRVVCVGLLCECVVEGNEGGRRDYMCGEGSDCKPGRDVVMVALD